MKKATELSLDELHQAIGDIDRVVFPDRYRELMLALRGRLDGKWDKEAMGACCTTAFELAGWEVGESLGVVRGLVVRSRSIVGNFFGAFQILWGGNLSVYRSLCEKARSDAFEQMLGHAAEKGANGVIGIRYDSTDLMSGVTEVLCYGTAVRLRKAEELRND